MIPPINTKKYKRVSLKQKLMDEKNQAEDDNDAIMTTKGDEAGDLDGEIISRIIASTIVKKKNRLGLFYKRDLTLTDEPRLFYCKNNTHLEIRYIDLKL